MAFPDPVSVTTTSFPGSTPAAHPVNMPATVNAGDMLLVILVLSGDNPVNSAPAGWKSVGFDSYPSYYASTVWTKEAVGNEDGTTVDFTANYAGIGVAQCYRITGAGKNHAYVAKNLSLNPPNCTPFWPTADTLWIAAVGNYSPSGTPSGYTAVTDAAQGTFTLRSAWKKANAASEDPGSFSSSTVEATSFTIAICPPTTWPELAAPVITSSSNGFNEYLSMPATVKAGTLLIGILGAAGPVAATTPSGWTEIFYGYAVGVASNPALKIVAKISDGTEGGTAPIIVIDSSTVKCCTQVFNWDNWHGTNLPEVSAAVASNSTSINIGSLTPSWGAKNTLWMPVVSRAESEGMNVPPTDYGSAISQGNFSSGTPKENVATCRRYLNAASEDPGALTYATNSRGSNSILLAIQAVDPIVTGGAVATINVSASGGGLPYAEGGSTATVNVTASGGGAAILSGGAAATVEVSAVGDGVEIQTEEEGSEAFIAVIAYGDGITYAEGGSVATVNVSASGDGIQYIEDGSTATINVTASGGGGQYTEEGSVATVQVYAYGNGTAFDYGEGGSTATVNVTASGDGFKLQEEEGGGVALVEVSALGGGAEIIQGGGVATINVSASGAGSQHGPAMIVEKGSWISYRKLN